MYEQQATKSVNVFRKRTFHGTVVPWVNHPRRSLPRTLTRHRGSPVSATTTLLPRTSRYLSWQPSISEDYIPTVFFFTSDDLNIVSHKFDKLENKSKFEGSINRPPHPSSRPRHIDHAGKSPRWRRRRQSQTATHTHPTSERCKASPVGVPECRQGRLLD